MTRVVLPWPDKRLTPNAKRRTHWMHYRQAASRDRLAGSILTMAAFDFKARTALAAGDGPIPMQVTFYPPDKRHRDDDGMIGAFKHMRDGIADALGTSDRRFRPVYIVGEPAKPGRVEVVFTPLPSTA